jgi:hypothetical protein
MRIGSLPLRGLAEFELQRLGARRWSDGLASVRWGCLLLGELPTDTPHHQS